MHLHKKQKSTKKWFIPILFIIVYLSAAIIPYIPHKKVSESYKNQFQVEDFYSDTTGEERISYITDNMDALTYRLKIIEEAKEEVILSTFDFNGDAGGKDVMCSLLHAANRGVKVRIIVDGCSAFLDMRGNPLFQALASHENIAIKSYNSINLLKPWKLQARLHDKYLIGDQSMYLLGGRNTTSLFLGDYSSHKNIDKELFVYETGEVSEDTSLSQLKQYFEQVWALPTSKEYGCKKFTKKVETAYIELEKRYEKIKKQFPKVWEMWDYKSLTMATDQIRLLSNPIETGNKEPQLWYGMQQLMLQGNKATIYTPYIICGKEMYEDLGLVTKNLENLEIITNDVSSGANPWGCTDYLNQRKNIWKTGAKVYEYLGPYSNHTKAVVIDEEISMIGSYNLDMRSTYLNTELMLVVDSKELNLQIQDEIKREKTYSRTMTEEGLYQYGEDYEKREMSLGKQILYRLLRVLTIPIRRFL